MRWTKLAILASALVAATVLAPTIPIGVTANGAAAKEKPKPKPKPRPATGLHMPKTEFHYRKADPGKPGTGKRRPADTTITRPVDKSSAKRK
jgi:hypothetical protein